MMSPTPCKSLEDKFLQKRSKCFLTGAEDLEHLVTLPSFPVGMYCVPLDSTAIEYTTDMTWLISKSTGAIQLSNLIDLSVLYDSQHESGAVGGLWQRHHEEFCVFIEKFSDGTILEIGGGHGNLARLFVERNPSSRWIIVEPNLPPSLSEGTCPSQIVSIEGWFNKDFKLPEGLPDVDVVVHSHTLEHIYEYEQFLEAVTQLKPSLHIFSIPYQQEWLRRGWQNSIMFEHPQLLTPAAIDFLLTRHGFRFKQREVFADAHSLFYCFSYDGVQKLSPTPTIPNEYDENRRLFSSWLLANKEFTTRVNQLIATNKNQRAIYVFGAHIFTQYLVSFGLSIDEVTAILDNATDKQGKRLYGLRQEILSPQVLRGVKDPAVILRVGAYADEIKQGILKVNPGTTFWE